MNRFCAQSTALKGDSPLLFREESHALCSVLSFERDTFTCITSQTQQAFLIISSRLFTVSSSSSRRFRETLSRCLVIVVLVLDAVYGSLMSWWIKGRIPDPHRGSDPYLFSILLLSIRRSRYLWIKTPREPRTHKKKTCYNYNCRVTRLPMSLDINGVCLLGASQTSA